jgi:hypothetical protein
MGRRSSADLWLAGGLIVVAVYFFSGYFTTVRFERERIQVQVGRGAVRISGLYEYRNRSWLPAVLTLGVPFPADQAHPAPAFPLLTEAVDGGGPVLIPYTSRGGEVRFRLFFRPQEVKRVRLEYEQPARLPNGRYLLTTTRAWRRPIEDASFTLLLPRCYALAASNYPLTALSAPGGRAAFSFSRDQFYPDRDWEFAWEERQPCVPAQQARFGQARLGQGGLS